MIDWKIHGLSLALALGFILITSHSLEAVVLQENVEVEVGPLKLADIVEESISEEWGQIRLGNLPRPGNSRFISRAYIIMQARSQNINAPEFSGGPIRTKINRPYRFAPEEELKNKIYELIKRSTAGAENVEISLEKYPEQLKIIPAPFELELQGTNLYRQHRGSSWFNVNVIQRGAITTDFRVKANVSEFRKVPVASQRIERGVVVNESLIEWRELDTTEIRGSLIHQPDQIVGFEVERTFRPGQVITANDLQRPEVIRRRSNITIIYDIDGLTITASGIAMEDGAMGDEIKVRNKSSDNAIMAKIVGERTVKVQ